MFEPLTRNIFRWETPFPQNDQNLVGHLILRDSECILVDPPVVPGLVETVKRLGNRHSIVLTSQNHVRGTEYIASKTGATVYKPDQDQRAVDPRDLISVGEIKGAIKFGEGEVIGMKVMKDFYDFALITDDGVLLVSDNGRGTRDGKLVLWPESMNFDPPEPPNETIHREFKDLVRKSGAQTLLAGHGYDIIGNLQELAEDL